MLEKIKGLKLDKKVLAIVGSTLTGVVALIVLAIKFVKVDAFPKFKSIFMTEDKEEEKKK